MNNVTIKNDREEKIYNARTYLFLINKFQQQPDLVDSIGRP